MTRARYETLGMKLAELSDSFALRTCRWSGCSDMCNVIQIPTRRNIEARFDDLCRQARLRLLDLQQMQPHCQDDEQASALLNMIDSQQRLNERLEALRQQAINLGVR